MAGDILTIEGDKQPGESLIVQVMRGGKRIGTAPTLDQIRDRAVHDLARLPLSMVQLQPGADYPVEVAEALRALAAQADAGLKR
jgi:nicotinate phosphoribosyltransferase